MRKTDDIARMSQKIRTVIWVAFAFFIVWCCGTAAVFGFGPSVLLIWLGAIPFVGWEGWYLYVAD